MAKQVTVQELRQLLDTSGGDIALVDVREVAEYNLAHIAGSSSIPRRQIEFRLTQLVPWHGTPTVVCDDDGVRANLAAATLESMGYTNVSVLNGGLNRWVTDGHGTEWGVNVPSKDFGEKVLLQQESRSWSRTSWPLGWRKASNPSCSTRAHRRSTTAPASPAAAPCPAPS